MTTAADLIAALGLVPLLPEGGYFRETYRSTARHGGKALATAIYYLLTPDTFSAMHRLPTDEVYHFYLGDPVRLLQLGPDGGQVIDLGPDLAAGQRPQWVVPAGAWQGSCLVAGGRFALLGTTMAPGYDPSDYEAGDRGRLTAAYPPWAALIAERTRR